MKAAVLLRAAWREARGARGRTAFLGACIAFGVAAVTGVAALVHAVDAGVRAKSRELLGADVRVRARQPFSSDLEAVLDERFADWRRADVRELSTMVAAGEQGRGSRLCELKAVLGDYPLRGALVTDPPGLLPGRLADDEVLVGPDLAASFGTAVGGEVVVGGERFRIAGLVLDEPDRLDFALTLGPRVFLSQAGLARTALTGFGSRVSYNALLASVDGLAPAEETRRAAQLLRGRAGGEYARVETYEEAQPRVRRSLGRLERYLGLAALLSLVLGGAGVAQLVRLALRERARSVAVLRTLGLRSREVAAIFLAYAAGLALVAAITGALCGAALPWLARVVAPDLLPADVALPWPAAAVARGIALGVGVATFFALVPLSAVWRVPPALVLRAEAAPLPVPRAVRWAAFTALAVAVAGAAWVQGGELPLALASAGGLAAAALALFGGARAVVALVARLPRERLSPTLRHGLAALARPGEGTVGGIVALGIGVLAIATLALVERALADELGGALPADAPTLFLTDVQPDQWDGVQQVLARHGAQGVDAVPVVMARLAAVDGVPVSTLVDDSDRRREGRGRWVLTREQRLTWLDALPAGNELVAGAWWSDPVRGEVSLEEDFAEELGVAVGGTLRFDVQGVPLDFVVTSLRRVDWSSMRINFFVVAEPGALEDAPGFRLASARVDAAEEGPLAEEVTRAFPNVTVLPLRPILERVRGLLGRLALAVEVLGGFSVAAGLVVLAGSAAASAGRRRREAALLKVLGVTRRGVALYLTTEFALVGLVAGVVGGGAAALGAWLFVERTLELDARFEWLAAPLSGACAGLLAAAAGLAASRRALAARPLEGLR